jgi:hypothetical protein
MLESVLLPLARYRFSATFDTSLPLPSYSGSLLRGAFGTALRRSTCMTGLPVCGACPLRQTCPYTTLFEAPPRDTPLGQKFSEVPNPYVLEPPAPGRNVLPAGEPLVFHMVLVGERALQQLPLVIHAWQRALAHGLGPHRIAGVLQEVHWKGADAAHRVFAAVEGQTLPHDCGIRVPAFPGGDRLVLDIRTPLRLQHEGHALGPQQLNARTLVAAALRRATLMLHLHASQTPPTASDASALVQGACLLDEDRTALRWFDWTRFSSRQQQKMTLGGVVGRWSLHGNVEPLWPWLWLGQWLHVGKNATMGLGGYDLQAG